MEGDARISELGHEKDDLHSNAEQLPGIQNIFGSIDFVSLIQGRRSGGLEKVLQECTQKLEICQRENSRLQEELSEVYIIKSKFAEQSKAEAEKSSSLEKEVKFYQTQMAVALSDRDRSLSEIQTFQKRERVATKKINELQRRLDLVTSEYEKEQDRYSELQKHQETFHEEISIYRELVERFWKVREQVVEHSNVETIMKKAAILLQDPDVLWSYGEMQKPHVHDQIVQVTEELIAEEENFEGSDGQKFADCKDTDAASHCWEQLSCLADLLITKVQQLHSANKSLKDDISFFIKEERIGITSLLEFCKQFGIQYSGDWDTKKDANDEDEAGKASIEREMGEEKQKIESEKKKGRLVTSLQEPTDNIMLGNNSLTGNTKASELLSIHQQGDIDDLVPEDPEISFLKQQLLQVTSEKVNALMQLEQLQKECLILQDRERASNQKDMFSTRGQTASSSGDKSMTSEGAKSRGYLRPSWRYGRVPSMPIKSLINVSSTKASKESDHETVSKLRRDNAALRESLWCIHNLCKTVKDLRQTIAKAGIEPKAQTEVYGEDAMNALDSVISEASHLEVAVKLSLPSNNVEWNKVESSVAAGSGNDAVFQDFSDGEATNDDEVDTVAFSGLEMVRLLLFAAKLKRRSIQKPHPE